MSGYSASPIDRLLTVAGEKRAPKDVYRKITPKKAHAPAKAEAVEVAVEEDELAEVED